MLTVPVSIWAAMRRPFATSRVQTDALSPNSESLARVIASVSSATSRMATTGPNVSSRQSRMSSVTPVSTVGS
jgi:hypothetical protein